MQLYIILLGLSQGNISTSQGSISTDYEPKFIVLLKSLSGNKCYVRETMKQYY